MSADALFPTPDDARTPSHACSGLSCQVCHPRPHSGSQRRDTGMALAESGAGVIAQRARDEWNARFDRWIGGFARQRRRFTTDEVRAVLVDNEPPSAKMWGPAYKRAMSAGLIRRVGYTEATTASRHAGIATVYEWAGGA